MSPSASRRVRTARLAAVADDGAARIQKRALPGDADDRGARSRAGASRPDTSGGLARGVEERKVERDAQITLAAPADEVQDVTNEAIDVVESNGGIIESLADLGHRRAGTGDAPARDPDPVARHDARSALRPRPTSSRSARARWTSPARSSTRRTASSACAPSARASTPRSRRPTPRGARPAPRPARRAPERDRPGGGRLRQRPPQAAISR